MNKIPIITVGASDNKLVPIRGTVGKSALQFFADGLLVTPAAGSMTELYATEEALRIFYGWVRCA